MPAVKPRPGSEGGGPSLSHYGDCHAVVMGAAGFVGRWVSRVLTASGARLTLMVRDRAEAERVFGTYGVRGEIVEVDLERLDQVAATLGAVRPSITFNLAAYGVDRSQQDEAKALRLNADLPRAVCHALAPMRDPAWHGRRLVHAGSAAEYGATADGDVSEESEPRPATPYGRSKTSGTRIVAERSRALGLGSVTARVFWAYGPGERPGRLLPSLLRLPETLEPLPLTAGTQERDFVYVEDVAEALLRLGLTHGAPGEVVNVASGRLVSVRRFAETAADVLGVDRARLQFGARPTEPDAPVHRPVPLERLRSLTGWTPPTAIDDGIRRTVEFERARARRS